jgi:hypothetical protein
MKMARRAVNEGRRPTVDATNPYQHDGAEVRHRRRSLVEIVSASLGSILALVVLNLVVRGPQSTPVTEIEITPAAQRAPVIPVATLSSPTTAVATSAPATTVPATTSPTTLTSSTLPVATVPPTTVPPSTTPGSPRWWPPNTPDYVRAAVLDSENLDVVAPVGDGNTAYFAVSARVRTACGGAVYRVVDGQERELIDGAAHLFPRNDNRWLVIASFTANDCRPQSLQIIDAFNATSQRMPAAGWFSTWSAAHARFVTYDYTIGRFTLYDAPSATSLGLGVAPSFTLELDERVGAAPEGRPAWVMGRVAFLAEGDLVAHIQCQTEACAKKDAISGWFYVVDGQVKGESGRVPADKAPPLALYCGV